MSEETQYRDGHCPVCGTKGEMPDMPLAVGTDDPYAGTVSWIQELNVLACEKCGTLFVRRVAAPRSQGVE